jgi:hypothetical protein
VSAVPVSSSQPAAGGTVVPLCAHCGEEIRHCPGTSPLPRWGSTQTFSDCRFGDGFVHASGHRAGSHVCGKGGRLATPSAGQAGRP